MSRNVADKKTPKKSTYEQKTQVLLFEVILEQFYHMFALNTCSFGQIQLPQHKALTD